MGLDISVCKIVTNNTKGKNNMDYFRLVDDKLNYKNNFPEWTKEFERTKTENVYDWKKFKENTGIDINNCELLVESYSKDGCFLELWPLEFGKCPNIDAYKTGNDENGNPKYDWDNYEKDRKKHIIKVDLSQIPTYKKKIKILWYETVGYQRKGLNSNFYSDCKDGKIGYFVWSKNELERYMNDYCDEPYEYVYSNGEKSGEMIYPKNNFKENIIDNFVEGECCVTFDW